MPFYGNAISEDYLFEITSKQINELIEDCKEYEQKNSGIVEEAYQEAYNQIVLREDVAQEFDINIAAIKTCAKKIAEIIKTKGINKEARTEIKVELDKMYETIGQTMNPKTEYPAKNLLVLTKQILKHLLNFFLEYL